MARCVRQVPRALSSQHASQGASLLSETAQVLRTQRIETSTTQGSEEKVPLVKLYILMHKLQCLRAFKTYTTCHAV